MTVTQNASAPVIVMDDPEIEKAARFIETIGCFGVPHTVVQVTVADFGLREDGKIGNIPNGNKTSVDPSDLVGYIVRRNNKTTGSTDPKYANVRPGPLQSYLTLAALDPNARTQFNTQRRLAEDCRARRALFCDFEPDDKLNQDGTLREKRYGGDKVAALRDFKAYLGEQGVAKPNVITWTGNGWQFFWTTIEPMTMAEWEDLQQRHEQSMRQYSGGPVPGQGLPHDPVANPDRIARIPGTMNIKGKDKGLPPKRCELIKCDPGFSKASLQQLFAKFTPGQSAGKAPSGSDVWAALRRSWNDSGRPDYKRIFGDYENDLADGVEDDAPEKSSDDIATACAVVRRLKVSGAANHFEWHSVGLNLAPHLSDGLGFAHEISKHHPSYDAQSLEDAFRQRASERQGKGPKPTKCAKIADKGGCQECKTCAHLAAKSSPFWLAVTFQSQSQSQSSAGPGSFAGEPLDLSAPPPDPREWAYGTKLLFSEVTLLAAAGATGKTALAMLMTMSIAAGKEFGKEKIWDGSSVVTYISSEDTKAELTRRMLGPAKYWQLSQPDALNIRRHGVDAPYGELTLTCSGGHNGSVETINVAGFERLEAIIRADNPRVVFLDLLNHLIPEGLNNNGLMGRVIKHLKLLAEKYKCAIVILHHIRKGGDADDVDSVKGAGALKDHARIVYMLAKMRKDEASKYRGIQGNQHQMFVRLVEGKLNLAPPSDDTQWYELRSIKLGNASAKYPAGDSVQVAVPIDISRLKASPVAPNIDLAVQQVILTATAIAQPPFTASRRGGSDRYVVDNVLDQLRQLDPELQKMSEPDLRKQVEAVVEDLKAVGALVVRDVRVGRNTRQGLVVDWSKSPFAGDARQMDMINVKLARHARRQATGTETPDGQSSGQQETGSVAPDPVAAK